MKPFQRALRYLIALQHGREVSVRWIRDTFGVSLAQAKRDFIELERTLPVVREKRIEPHERAHTVLVPLASGTLWIADKQSGGG